jgi:cytochrome c
MRALQTTDGNKVAMALLMVLLLTKGLGVVTSAIYAPSHPAKPGYDLPGAPEAKAAVAAAPETPLPVLMAKADVDKGKADTKVCQACHTFEKGGAAKVGPPLYGVVGRAVASVPGFAYSDALKAKGGVWTYEDIFKFITKPSAYAPGTKMTFPGESDPFRRADILDYLRTDSDAPVDLPK